MKKNNFLSTLLILGLAFVGFVLLSYIAVYALWTMFTTKVYFWNVELLQNKTFHILCLVLALALEGIAVWTLFKYNLLSFSKLINKSNRADSDAFGSARWQTQAEIKAKYGDYDFERLPEIEAEGYVLNSYFGNNNTLKLSMIPKQNALLVGAPGTGKSNFYLGPNIQANAHSKTKVSMVINDLKGELYSLHSKMLQEEGYDVIKIDLRNPHTSDRYNPLSLIWDLYYSYLETKNIAYLDRVSVYINEVANCLCPEGKGEQQQWSKGANSIITAIIWAMLEDSTNPKYGLTRDMFTILQISNIVNRQKSSLESFLSHRIKTYAPKDFAGMILDNPSEKTVASYFATLSTALTPFLEPGLQKVTSGTDIDISKLSIRPTALFIVIPDELKSRSKLGTMILSQIYNYLVFEASQLPNERLQKNVYFLLDEFGNLPIIQDFPSWVALGRGRGIFFNIIVQADSQLKSVYGDDGAKSIMQNCHVQVLLGASEIETLKRFEDLFGKYTIYQRSANIDHSNSSLSYKGSTGLTSKDLITLDQLQRIPKGEIYFKILGEQPCRTHLIPLFDKNAQKHFIRGAMIEKGALGRATEIDREKLYYDLNKRESIYMQAQPTSKTTRTVKPKPGGPATSQTEPSVSEVPTSEEIDVEYIEIDDISTDMYEAILKPANFKAVEGSYDDASDTLSVLVPPERKHEALQIIQDYLNNLNSNAQDLIDNNSSIDRNIDLFSNDDNQ